MTRIKRTVGNRLRVHRLRMGYEQLEVAYLLGLKSHTRISQWEKGFKKPSLENLLLLSFAYQTLPDELYLDLRHELRLEFEQRLQKLNQFRDIGG
jgi:transcriptional regulator with XRE-family HTH domain